MIEIGFQSTKCFLAVSYFIVIHLLMNLFFVVVLFFRPLLHFAPHTRNVSIKPFKLYCTQIYSFYCLKHIHLVSSLILKSQAKM